MSLGRYLGAGALGAVVGGSVVALTGAAALAGYLLLSKDSPLPIEDIALRGYDGQIVRMSDREFDRGVVDSGEAKVSGWDGTGGLDDLYLLMQAGPTRASIDPEDIAGHNGDDGLLFLIGLDGVTDPLGYKHALEEYGFSVQSLDDTRRGTGVLPYATHLKPLTVHVDRDRNPSTPEKTVDGNTYIVPSDRIEARASWSRTVRNIPTRNPPPAITPAPRAPAFFDFKGTYQVTGFTTTSDRSSFEMDIDYHGTQRRLTFPDLSGIGWDMKMGHGEFLAPDIAAGNVHVTFGATPSHVSYTGNDLKATGLSSNDIRFNKI